MPDINFSGVFLCLVLFLHRILVHAICFIGPCPDKTPGTNKERTRFPRISRRPRLLCIPRSRYASSGKTLLLFRRVGKRLGRPCDSGPETRKHPEWQEAEEKKTEEVQARYEDDSRAISVKNFEDQIVMINVV